MHSKMLKLFILLNIILAAYAAQYIIPSTPKPSKYANTAGCYIPEYDVVIPYDQSSFPSPRCERYNCFQSSGDTSVVTCPTYTFTDPTCSLVPGDSTKTYPDCCATVTCTNPNAVIIGT